MKAELTQVDLIGDNVVLTFSREEVPSGGNFLPIIELPFHYPVRGSTGVILTNVFTIGLPNITANESIVYQLEKIKQHTLITNAYIEQYNDCFNETVLVIFLEFKQPVLYSCNASISNNDTAIVSLHFK
ncbi:MAG: hypothetical protein KGZ63_12340 [Clostridiales bacterium]|jgi:hypothetical protein|nr:hypothetical protein [Clostridiales bacterium]